MSDFQKLAQTVLDLKAENERLKEFKTIALTLQTAVGEATTEINRLQEHWSDVMEFIEKKELMREFQGFISGPMPCYRPLPMTKVNRRLI